MSLKPFAKVDYFLTRWIFLRLLGLVYFFAFSSLATQIIGLFGSHGILPVANFLQAVEMNLGINRFWILPSIFWFNTSDAMLSLVCLAGIIFSILMMLGIGTGCNCLLLWFLYLSLANIGQDFLSFQWDALLLETGFLAIFLAPWQLPWKIFEWPWKISIGSFKWQAVKIKAPIIVIWLLRWLLFRLMFESGLVKLASGDITWRNLTALDFHYLTQPLPTPLAWYVAKLPHWFNEISVVFVFAIELLIPLLIFMGRKARIIAAFVLTVFQILIALTGNYAYFNLLTIALCICLLDDQFIKVILAKLPFAKDTQKMRLNKLLDDLLTVRPLGKVHKIISIVVAIFIACISVGSLGRGLVGLVPIPEFLETMHDLASTYFICNSYGLFAVMTTKRIEIQIEGSNDNKSWQEYEFKYKPGNLTEAPCVVAPFQPRLDWQMWFAALGGASHDRWFINLIFRLLQGEKTVLDLLAKNPFPDNAPKYIRARFYDYHFTKASERKLTGNWWKRELFGECLPPACLEKQDDKNSNSKAGL